jgi:hypothetical protein
MKRIVVKGATTVRIVCPVRLKSAGVKDIIIIIKVSGNKQ